MFIVTGSLNGLDTKVGFQQILKILGTHIFRFLCSALYSVAWGIDGIVSKLAATLIFLRHKIRMGPPVDPIAG